MFSIKKLFSFTNKEVAFFFANARILTSQRGLKLYTLKQLTTLENASFGKILIITPRKSGNAIQRNLFRRRVKAIFYEDELYKTTKTFALYAYKDGIALSHSEIKAFLHAHVSKFLS